METGLPWFVAIIFGVEGLAFIAVIVIIIYLIFRRIRLKKKEDFEKRDN